MNEDYVKNILSPEVKKPDAQFAQTLQNRLEVKLDIGEPKSGYNILWKVIAGAVFVLTLILVYTQRPITPKPLNSHTSQTNQVATIKNNELQLEDIEKSIQDLDTLVAELDDIDFGDTELEGI